MNMEDRTIEDAKRYAELRAEETGLKWCVRKDNTTGKTYVTPAADEEWPEFKVPGNLLYTSENGK